MVTTGMRYAVSKLFVKLRLQNIQYFWEDLIIGTALTLISLGASNHYFLLHYAKTVYCH